MTLGRLEFPPLDLRGENTAKRFSFSPQMKQLKGKSQQALLREATPTSKENLNYSSFYSTSVRGTAYLFIYLVTLSEPYGPEQRIKSASWLAQTSSLVGKVLKDFGRGGMGCLPYICSRTFCSRLKADVRL